MTRATRLPDVPFDQQAFPEGFQEGEMSYWRKSKTWMLHLGGYTIGNLSRHDVEEHEDGTITVSPSILVTARGMPRRHGYLRRGVWEPCGDDQP